MSERSVQGRSGRGAKTRALLALSVHLTARTYPVTKYDVAALLGVGHRTALRYLHDLHAEDLVEEVERGGACRLSLWSASPGLRNLMSGAWRHLPPPRMDSGRA